MAITLSRRKFRERFAVWKAAWWPDPAFARELWQLILFSRIALMVVGLIGLTRFPWRYVSPTFNVTQNPLVLMWVRWDGLWYTDISVHGYWTQALAFFPLYPLLIAGVHEVTRMPAYDAALLVSNAGFIGFVVVLFGLVKDEYGPELAMRSVWMAVMFPTAFFMSAAYTEGVFLFFSVGAFWLAKRERFWWAGVFGMLAGLTRNEGAFTVIPFLWAYYRKYGIRWHRDLLAAGLIPLGIMAFMAYQWVDFGSPLAFVDAQSFWGRQITWPWRGIVLAVETVLRGSPLQADTILSMIDLTFAVGSMALWVFGLRRRLPVDWLLYWGVLLLIDISAPDVTGRSPLLSMSRLVLILFPMFVALGLLSGKVAWLRFLQWILPALQVTFFLVFATWHWIA